MILDNKISELQIMIENISVLIVKDGELLEKRDFKDGELAVGYIKSYIKPYDTIKVLTKLSNSEKQFQTIFKNRNGLS